MTRARVPKRVWFHLHVTTEDGTPIDVERVEKPDTPETWRGFFNVLRETLTAGGVMPLTEAPEPALMRGDRERLPNRRDGGYTQKIKIGGNALYLRTGQFPDGRLGEIFLDTAKEGSALRTWMNQFAIAVSLGLQYGIPLGEFVDAFMGVSFEPNGPVLGHPDVQRARSLLDAVVQDLGANYTRAGFRIEREEQETEG